MANYYIGAGLLSDYQTIINKFEELEDQTFSRFLALCEKHNFFYIFYGHSNLTEKLEFTEEAIKIAKEMWLESVTLVKKVNCFFLLAALYIHQPLEVSKSLGPVKIRLTECELEALQKFVLNVRSENLEEVNNIFEVLYAQGAFTICYSQKVHGLEKSFLRYFAYNSEQTSINIESFFDLLCQEGGSLDCASKTLGDYCKLKKGYLSTDSCSGDGLSDELSLIDEKFCQEICTVPSYLPPTSLSTEPRVEAEKESIEQRRKQIKCKAFKGSL